MYMIDFKSSVFCRLWAKIQVSIILKSKNSLFWILRISVIKTKYIAM